jgi:hypothetical protein
VPAWAPDGGNAFPSGGGGGYDGGGHAPCFWAGADYLLWWVKDGHLLFPFVLTGDPAALNAAGMTNPGALNAGGFPTLTGNKIDYETLSGVRATVGGMLGGDGGLGIEGSGFILPRQSKSFRAASDANGNPVLGFRYLDTLFNTNPATGPEDNFQASIPGLLAGSVTVVSNTRLWSAEANAILGGGGGGGSRLQILGGFRYVDLSEDLSLLLRSTAIGDGAVFFLGNAFGPPSTVTSTDTFRTRNQFYGGQLGARGEFGTGRLVIGVSAKCGLGNMHEVVEVRGVSTLSPDFMSVPSGQFAGPSNIGRRTHDDFAVVPEAEIKVGFQVTSCLRATVGYNFLYISRVVRPGDQIDLVVNDSTNPLNGAFGTGDTTAAPRPFFNKTDFWAQGLTFGIELSF